MRKFRKGPTPFSSLQQSLAVLAATASLTLAATPVLAAYPDRPITMIVPATPGGLTDTTARYIAEELREVLQQQVIVENQPGAAGMIATRNVARAKPDGYTILLTYTAHMTAPVMYPDDAGYHPVDSFAAISQLADAVGIIAVSADSPYKTWADLEKHAREQKHPISYGIAGVGSSPHFYGMSIADGAGMKLEVIPYRGESPLMTDLIGGVVTTAMVSPTIFKPMVPGGKVRGLVVTSKQRSPAVPDIPTMDELGLKRPGNVNGFIGILAPAGTPPEIVDQLSGHLQKIMKKPAVQARFVENFGLSPIGSSAQEFSALLKADYPQWVAARDAYNIKP